MKFIYLQSIVNYRVPVNSDGSLGEPQIMAKWTKEKGAPTKKKPTKKVIKRVEAKASIGEVEF